MLLILSFLSIIRTIFNENTIASKNKLTHMKLVNILLKILNVSALALSITMKIWALQKFSPAKLSSFTVLHFKNSQLFHVTSNMSDFLIEGYGL